MKTVQLATLVEASNLLLGLERKLSKTQEEPRPLPQESAVQQVVANGFGATTRAKRNVVFSDGGMQASQNRFYSEYHHIQGPVCDMRPNEEVFGGSSRLEMYSSAHLSNDQGYLLAHAKQSEFEYNYRVAFPPNKLGKQFGKECSPYLGGCRQFRVDASVVDDYDKVIPGTKGWTRVGERPQTELVGGAFKARGEGILRNPDALSAAWTPINAYRQHCNKSLSEVTYDTWQCMGASLASEPKQLIPQDTRQGMQYITKC